MIKKLIDRVLSRIYKYHRIRYERYLSKYYICLGDVRRLSLGDRYLHKAVKHEKWCNRLDNIIYSLEDPV